MCLYIHEKLNMSLIKTKSSINPLPVSSGFQVKDAREKLGQKDARFKIRGRGGAGGVQDARQMINSRKQGQNQLNFSVPATQKTAVTHQLQSQKLVPQIQIHTNNNLAGVNTRQFASNVQGLSVRGSTTPQMSVDKRMVDARDRLSLKRSIGGTQTHAAAAPPLKITKTIQVRFKQITVFVNAHWHSLHVLPVIMCRTVQAFWHASSYRWLLFLQQRPVGMSGGIRPATQVELFYFSSFNNRDRSLWIVVLKRFFCLPQPVSNEHDDTPTKQIKIITANNMLQSRVRAAPWQRENYIPLIINRCNCDSLS